MADSPRFLKAEAIVDFPKAEEAVRTFWKENRIFEKSVEMRKGRKSFVWNDGPPTANGKPHNGHDLTRVFTAISARCRCMRGRSAAPQAGGDTHGLPAEVGVEKEPGFHGTADIGASGIEAFVQRCMRSVFRYTQEWGRMTALMATWLALKNAS